MELAFVWNNFWTQLFLFLLKDCAPLMLKQISLCSVNTFLLLKQCKKTLAKLLFVFILCFVKHKSVKIFDIHIMWLVFVSYKQQVYRVFKFLIWNVNWKSQLVFITIHINANVAFLFNLAKIFLSHRELNPVIIKIISKLFIGLSNSFWMSFYGINMPNMKPKKTFLIVTFDVD